MIEIRLVLDDAAVDGWQTKALRAEHKVAQGTMRKAAAMTGYASSAFGSASSDDRRSHEPTDFNIGAPDRTPPVEAKNKPRAVG